MTPNPKPSRPSGLVLVGENIPWQSFDLLCFQLFAGGWQAQFKVRAINVDGVSLEKQVLHVCLPGEQHLGALLR